MRRLVWAFAGRTYHILGNLISWLILFVLMLYIPVNNFSVMPGQYPVFMGWTSTKQLIKCLAQGHNTVTPANNLSIPSLTLYQLSHSAQHYNEETLNCTLWHIYSKLTIACQVFFMRFLWSADFFKINFFKKFFKEYFFVFVWLYVPVNNYGHIGMVSSPSHLFSLGNLEQAVNQYFVHILSFVTDNNLSRIRGR